MRRLLAFAVLTSMAATPALAHVGVGATDSFTAGALHPLGGLDHMLAMVTVGLWGVLAGGRALWLWPAAFVSTMIAGFGVAALGLDVPFVEPVILASAVVLGLLVLLAIKASLWAGAVIVAAFAYFHGFAHGSEAGAASLLPYAAGFVLSTIVLHLAGIALGLLMQGRIGQPALRVAGGAVMIGGLAIAAGML